MSAKSSRIPSYCTHTARNQAYVRLNGDMIYLGPPGSPESKQKYDRLIAEWMQAGRTYVKPDDRASISVNEVLLAFRRHAEQVYRDPDGNVSSEVQRVNLAFRPVSELYGTVPASQFGPLALQAVRGKMIDEGLTRTTINQRIGVIKRAWRWAAAQELIPASPSHALDAVEGLRYGRSAAKEGKEVKPVPDHLVNATLKHLPPSLQAMVQFQKLTGARSGEVCIMRRIDIEMTGDGKPWLYRPQRHKTQRHGHQRVIAVGPQAQEALRPYLKPGDPKAFIFSPALARAERNAAKRASRKSQVPPSQMNRKKRNPKRKPGPKWTPDSFGKALQGAIEKAVKNGDLPHGTHWHPHQLRHAAATRIRKEHGLDAVRATLGHRTVVQSAEYAELDAELAAATAAAIG